MAIFTLFDADHHMGFFLKKIVNLNDVSDDYIRIRFLPTKCIPSSRQHIFSPLPLYFAIKYLHFNDHFICKMKFLSRYFPCRKLSKNYVWSKRTVERQFILEKYYYVWAVTKYITEYKLGHGINAIEIAISPSYVGVFQTSVVWVMEESHVDDIADKGPVLTVGLRFHRAYAVL